MTLAGLLIVAEQELNRAQIAAGFEEMRGVEGLKRLVPSGRPVYIVQSVT